MKALSPIHLAVLALAFLLTNVAAATTGFQTPTIVSPVSGTQVVAVDLNNDGRVDIVVVDASKGTLTVQLGNGDGTFQAAMTPSAGPNVSAVAVADFNGDGIPDLAVVSANAPTFSTTTILLGKGDGSFNALPAFRIDSNPVAVEAADLNGDGKADLIVVAEYGVVTTLLGNGDGTFKKHAQFPSTGGVLSVVLGDFNGDGKVDLAVMGQHVFLTSTTTVLFGNGDGTFTPVAQLVTSMPYGWLVAADFLGNGMDQLAITTACLRTNGCTTGIVSVYEVSSAGMSQVGPTMSVGGSVGVGLAADLNGDGKADLVLGGGNLAGLFGQFVSTLHHSAPIGGALNVLLSNGDGTFRETDFDVGAFPFALVAADFNGDGKLDVLAASEDLHLALGNGDGTFQAGRALMAGYFPTSGIAGDFNNDGKTDLMVIESGYGIGAIFPYPDNILPLFGDGAGFLQPGTLFASFHLMTSTLAAGDLNHDGIPDLVATNIGGAGLLTVMLGNGNGTFSTPVSVNPPSVPFGCSGSFEFGGGVLELGDFNGDGNLDVLAFCGEAGFGPTVGAVYLGDGTGKLSSPPITFSTNNVFSALLGDFNNDGKLDVVTLEEPFTTPVPMLRMGNGDGSFGPPATIPGFTYPTSIAAGDFNHDGKLDLVVTDSFNNTVTILLGNGDGTFTTSQQVSGGSLFLSQLVVADFNGDGTLDIAVATPQPFSACCSFGGTGFWILLGNGDGTFQAPLFFTKSGGQLVVGDFNHDGKPDIAIMGDFVTVLLNQF